MTFKQTEFDGLIEVLPQKFKDERGVFFEAYHQKKFKGAGIDYNFVQDNQSFSKKGTIRGLHLQTAPYQQAKYVRVMMGKVLDVVIDLRKNSESFGRTYEKELSEENEVGLIIPPGFAHGFSALEDSVFYYKCSAHYDKRSEMGIIWNDKTLNIDWGVQNPMISQKDQQLPTYEEFLGKFKLI